MGTVTLWGKRMLPFQDPQKHSPSGCILLRLKNDARESFEQHTTCLWNSLLEGVVMAPVFDDFKTNSWRKGKVSVTGGLTMLAEWNLQLQRQYVCGSKLMEGSNKETFLLPSCQLAIFLGWKPLWQADGKQSRVSSKFGQPQSSLDRSFKPFFSL